MALPVALAVVLSAAVTLLLGGVFREGRAWPGRTVAEGAGRGCCAPVPPGGGAR